MVGGLSSSPAWWAPCSSCWSSRGRRSRSSRSGCSATGPTRRRSISTFFASFAFFGAIIFLPRWFQFVNGFSPTESGLADPAADGRAHLQLDQLGHDRARTGQLQVAGRLTGIGMMGMRHRPDDQADRGHGAAHPLVLDVPRRAGVGPTFSVFTIIVQNAVPFRPARRRYLQPDVLPPDRRDGRAGHHRHRLRSRPSSRRSARPWPRPMSRRRWSPASARRPRAGRSTSTT